MKRPWDIWSERVTKNIEHEWGTPQEKRGRRMSVMKHIVEMIDYDEVLDVGCGFGHLLYALRRWQDDDFDYLGFDSSKAMIKRAKKYFPEEKEKFVIGDVFKASEQFKPWDCVVASDLIIHLPEQLKVLKELWVVTKKTLIVTFKLAPKSVRYTPSIHRSTAGTLKFPKGKYVIYQWNSIEDVNDMIAQLDDVKKVERKRYDARTEIFKITRG